MKRKICTLMAAVMLAGAPGTTVCAQEMNMASEPAETENAEEPAAEQEEAEEGMLAGELPETEEELVGQEAAIKNNILLSNNTGRNEYVWNWAACMNSYLTVNSDGSYTRVEAANDGYVYIENYSADLQFLSNQQLQKELSLFGGFYDDGNYFYLAFGQNNTEQNDNKEVYRVVKYSRSWQRLGAASVWGANTTKPFNGGSLRMDSYGGELYVRTCHEMYASSDGLNHQANVTMKIHIADMSVSSIAYKVQNDKFGYSSHSFNQFIKADNGTVYALDHGDAYPRSAALFKYGGTNFGSSSASLVNTLNYAGGTGDNYTGATLGGFEISDYACLTAGSSIPQDGIGGFSNIYVTATLKNNFTESGTSLYWITDRTNESWSVGNPQLVEINKNSYLLLWTQRNGSAREVAYVPLDGYGRIQGEVRSFTGGLSDCQPVFDPQTRRVIWYVTDGYGMSFHTIDVGTWEHTENSVVKSLRGISLEPDSLALNKGDTAKLTVSFNPEDTTDDKTVIWASDNENVAQVDQDGSVTAVGNGTTTIRAYVGNHIDSIRVTVKSPLTGISLSETSIDLKSREYKYVTVIYTPEDTTDTKRVTWKSDDEKVATVSYQGRIYAVGPGSTLVHATVGDFSASVRVTVDGGGENQDDIQDQWPFIDVAVSPGNWRYENVKYVNDNGIMTGVKANEFQPDVSLTRSQFASVIYRMAGSPRVSYKSIFTDVPAGKWYSDAIIWAYENGIVAGLGGGRYGIDVNITREQMARMLMEYAKVRGYDTSERADFGKFADASQVSGWAAENMRWAVGSGIISGSTSGGRYYMNPKGEAKRVECAVMLTKFLQKYR